MYEYERVGRIFVDSGQIAVGDPCYTLGHPEDIGDGNLKLARDKDGGWLHDDNGSVIEVDETIGKLNAYSKFCQATLTGDNPYGIIAVNPKKFPHVEYKKSQKFIEWLITGEGKDVINRFTYNGEKLFHTN